MQLLRDRLSLILRQRIALVERVLVVVHRKVLDLLNQRRQITLRSGELVRGTTQFAA